MRQWGLSGEPETDGTTGLLAASEGSSGGKPGLCKWTFGQPAGQGPQNFMTALLSEFSHKSPSFFIGDTAFTVDNTKQRPSSLVQARPR